MLLNDYQITARETAVYPGSLSYPTHGLAGEFCEFVEKGCKDTKELGDMLWYLAAVAGDADLTLAECGGGAEKFDDLVGFQHIVHLDRMLAKGVGMVVENVKKCYRDDGGILSSKRREAIKTGIGIALNIMVEFAVELDTTLKEVAQENHDKLKSRQDRGTLRGSGDDR